MGIFSLTVTIDRKLPVKNDDLENKDSGKEKGLEKWQLSLIIGAVTFSVLLITLLVICRANLDSKKRAMNRANRNHRATSRIHPVNFDNVIANSYA